MHMLEDTKDYVVCMRRPNVGAREVVSWADAQIAPLRQVYNVPEPPAVPADLRDFYGTKPDADGIGGKGDGCKGKAPEDCDDVHTLEPVWDSRGRRHLARRDVCKHLSEETFSDWPDPDGVRTIMTFSNHIERHAQTPTAWFEQWCSSVGVANSDRIYHKVVPLMRAIEWGRATTRSTSRRPSASRSCCGPSR